MNDTDDKRISDDAQAICAAIEAAADSIALAVRDLAQAVREGRQ